MHYTTIATWCLFASRWVCPQGTARTICLCTRCTPEATFCFTCMPSKFGISGINFKITKYEIFSPPPVNWTKKKKKKQHCCTFLGPLKIFLNPVRESLDLSPTLPELPFCPSAPPGLESSEKSNASWGENALLMQGVEKSCVKIVCCCTKKSFSNQKNTYSILKEVLLRANIYLSQADMITFYIQHFTTCSGLWTHKILGNWNHFVNKYIVWFETCTHTTDHGGEVFFVCPFYLFLFQCSWHKDLRITATLCSGVWTWQHSHINFPPVTQVVWALMCCVLVGAVEGGLNQWDFLCSPTISPFHLRLMVRKAYEQAVCMQNTGSGGSHLCCCWPGCPGSHWCGGCPLRSSRLPGPPPPSWPSSLWPASSRHRYRFRSGHRNQSIWSCSYSCLPCHSLDPRRHPAPLCLQSQRTPVWSRP